MSNSWRDDLSALTLADTRLKNPQSLTRNLLSHKSHNEFHNRTRSFQVLHAQSRKLHETADASVVRRTLLGTHIIYIHSRPLSRSGSGSGSGHVCAPRSGTTFLLHYI